MRIFFLNLFLSVFISLQFGQKKDSVRLLDPDKVYFNQGCQKIDSSEFKEAIRFFLKAIKVNPMYHQAFNKIAYCKYKLGDLKGAEAELEKSIKIQPDDITTLKYMGFIFYEDREYEKSLACLDSARKHTNTHADYELEYLLGNLYFAKNDYKTAVAYYNSAIEIKTNYGDAYRGRGLTYQKMRNHKNAILDLSKALELIPADSSNAEVFRARSSAYFESGDYPSAIKDFSRLIIINPKDEHAYMKRGAAKIETGDYSGAIEDETRAIELNDDSFMAYNLRGVAKGGLKSFKPALEDLDKAIKIKFNYHAAYVNRASIRYALNDKKKACEDLYKADQLGSDVAFRYIENYCSNK